MAGHFHLAPDAGEFSRPVDQEGGPLDAHVLAPVQAFLAPDAVRLGGLAGFVGRQRHLQLVLALELVVAGYAVARTAYHPGAQLVELRLGGAQLDGFPGATGRPPCRERVWQYVSFSVVSLSFN